MGCGRLTFVHNKHVFCHRAMPATLKHCSENSYDYREDVESGENDMTIPKGVKEKRGLMRCFRDVK